jgi:mycofactocin system FadH/OYE family oxidoreductase 2
VFDHLFRPFELGRVALRNRVVFGPHVTMFGSADCRPTRRDRFYYEERARGGVGLIVTGSQFVHPTSEHSRTIDGSTREGALLWRDTIAAVHEHGARIFAQFTHHGIEINTQHTRRVQWGPSAVPNPAAGGEVPKAMTRADIRELEQAFAAAAGYAVEAGFDGVELKVGHDGLLRTFLSPHFNRRTDEYGGSLENRMRLALETIAGVRAAIGPDVPLGIRFCLDEGFPGGYGLDEAVEMARRFGASGHLDYLNADMGTWLRADLQVPPMTVPQGFALAATRRAREASGLPTVAFGRIKDPAMAEAALADGTADLVGLVRALLTDPEWANKAREGRVEDIRPCVACGQECVGRLARDLPIGCVHNPAAGDEERLGVTTLAPAPVAKRVVVVGGGAGGMKAAEVAAMRGHRVTLLERAPALGGQVALAATAPGHAEWGEIVTHLAGRLERLGVDVRTGVEATPDAVLAEAPDAVVVATGAGAGPPPFPAGDGVRVLDELRVLRGAEPAGEDVVLFDLGVRFEGSALAETLAARGNRVRWVTPAPTVAFQVDPTTMIPLRRRLGQEGVELVPESVILDAADGGVTVMNTMAATTSRLERVDTVVVAGGKAPRGALAEALEGRVPELHAIGDCVAPRHVAIAIREGELAGRAV